MGKKNFSSTIYNPAKRALGVSTPSVKISYFSDRYRQDGNFAGVIMYHWRGQFKWQNTHLGHRGQAFYVAILDTSKWPADAFQAAGQGRVHDYIFKKTFGEDYSNNAAAVGGFAIMNGQLKFSSWWLNDKENTSYANKWYTDGSKDLSWPEQKLVTFAVQEWARHGPHHICSIPAGLDQEISNSS